MHFSFAGFLFVSLGRLSVFQLWSCYAYLAGLALASNLSSRASASQVIELPVMPSLDGVSVFAQCQKAIDITLISLLTDIIHYVTLTTQIGLQGLMSPQMNW